MQYKVILKHLMDGDHYARCNAAPNGVAEGRGPTPESALEMVRAEIRYQLEYCPCSGVSDDYVQLEVVEESQRVAPGWGRDS